MYGAIEHSLQLVIRNIGGEMVWLRNHGYLRALEPQPAVEAKSTSGAGIVEARYNSSKNSLNIIPNNIFIITNELG